MKVLLMADGAVGAQVFDYLRREFSADLGFVATTAENELHFAAQAQGIPTAVFSDGGEFLAAVSEAGASEGFDLGVLAWWPKIIKEPLLSSPKYGFLNFHPSYLPHNRGKHYNFWALVEQRPFGVTLHLVDSGIDTGPIISQRLLPYDWTDTGGTLYERAQREIVALFRDTYPSLRDTPVSGFPQNLEEGSSHRARELDIASLIDLDTSYTARDLLNRLRARTFAGHPACRFIDDGQTFEVRVEIKKAES